MGMADPLSISASVAGLIALPQTLLLLLVNFVDNVNAYSKEFKDLVDEVRRFCGVLYALQPAIKSISMNACRWLILHLITSSLYIFSSTNVDFLMISCVISNFPVFSDSLCLSRR